MPYFAFVRAGIVERVERIQSAAMLDGTTESESVGQTFLANLYPGTAPSDYVLTHYPVGQPDPYPRGTYAAPGYTWDGTVFANPNPVPDAAILGDGTTPEPEV